LLAASALTALPAAANAVTATGTDPTGDVTAGPTYDITQLTVDLTPATVKVSAKFAAALPALSDPSWATENHDGRYLFIDLGDDLGYPSFAVFGDGAAALPSIYRLGNETCDDVTADVTGDTVSVSVSASCFNNPGKVEVQALVAKNLETSEVGDVDIAIAPQLMEDAEDLQLTSVTASLPGGYYQLAADGGVFAFGDAPFYGSTGNIKLNKPVVAMAPQPGGTGYRFVASDGGVFSYNAGFYGSMGGSPLNQPIVGMATTPTGNGYWLVASDGGIFAYGDAPFYGSTGGMKLNLPIVGMVPTPTGAGYWLVASDGGIFAYGDAKFFGSAGSVKLNSPIIGMVPTGTGNGYWLAARDGGIFAYGDAQFFGSGANYFEDNVVSIGRAADGAGYYLQSSDGDVMNYGSALDFGDAFRLELDLNQPMVGLAVKP
jgi:hypothetical protein